MSLYDNPGLLGALPFVAAATALLGSPGPGVAALVATGRTRGVTGGLGFYAAMQLGLMLAAGLVAAGLSAMLAPPLAARALTIAASAYLLWLAWRLASAPVGEAAPVAPPANAAGLGAGFLLGGANPKAYLAFAALMGSFRLIPGAPAADALAKWSLCVAVMLVVDLAWLVFGAAVGRLELKPRAERALNLVLGLMVAAAALAALA